MSGLVTREDGSASCWWPGEHADYREYHDHEWGLPVVDDHLLFEKICLEGFQSGLSWLTILRKRENFRRAFRDFEPEAVARYTRRSVTTLLKDEGIVRHKGKIEATINNARRAVELKKEFGSLAGFFWRFEPEDSDRPAAITEETLGELTQTAASRELSGALKRRGWKWVGPTTCYAFMQAMGMVNDHLEGCASRGQVEAARASLARPV